MKPTISVPPVRFAAEILSTTADKKARTVEVTFYSGSTVPRFSWSKGEYFLTFDLRPQAVRLQRLNSRNAPVLDSHDDWSTRYVLGVIEKAEIKDGTAKATMRFAEGDPDVDRVWNKIEQGILRNVSMGAFIHKMKQTSKEEDAVKSFLAVDWEPFEISIVPVGADPGAHVHMSRVEMMTEVEIERADDARPEGGTQKMEPKTGTGTSQAGNRTEEQIRLEGIQAERARREAIQLKAKPFLERQQITAAFVEKLITDNKTVEEAGAAILENLAKASAEVSIRGEATVTQTQREKFVIAMTAALAHRINPKEKVEDEALNFSSKSLLEMGRECLRATGRPNVDRLSRTECAEAALGLVRLTGPHTTSDFPLILANVANKTLLGAYAYANPTFRMWAKASTAADFKTISRLRLGEAPAPIAVPEGSAINFGTMSESREQYALATYGRRIAITRQALINDDLRAFSDIIPAFGIQVARLENSTVYAVLTANANMGDGVALFHATHANLAGSGGAIAIATLSAGRKSMMIQTGIDGTTKLNVIPRFLIVPAAQWTIAQQFTTEGGMFPAVQTNINPFAGKLQPIADAELDASSTTAWYLAADPAMGTVEFATLEGESGPRISTREGWEVEGVEIKVSHDFAAKATDWRGLYKDPGA